jgi:signal transduction histidine kinase
MADLANGAALLEGGAAVHPGPSGAPDGAIVAEHALRSEALGRVALGVAHDIRNPLNAMVLQVALLSDKLSNGDSGAATAHLMALRDQIARVNEVLRRLGDVVEPGGPMGVDLVPLVADAVSLLAHDARRRRVAFAVTASPAGGARTAADPDRAGRRVLGVLGAASREAPEGAAVSVQVARAGGQVVLAVEHPPAGAALADGALAAGLVPALGPAVAVDRAADRVRWRLSLPEEVVR